MEFPKIGTFVAIVGTNGNKAIGVVTDDPCHQIMIRALNIRGESRNFYKEHVDDWAEIKIEWEV